MKSRGFELIDNDSLRSKIISLYEYHYQNLSKLEEEYYELQFQENYFEEINRYIAANFEYDAKGNIVSIRLPLNLSPADKNLLLSYLWKIQVNRRFVMHYYDEVMIEINKLHEAIAAEIQT